MSHFARVRSALLVALLMGLGLPTPSAMATHGGEFTISSKAADPTTYGSFFPATKACPSGGRASEPIPGAQHGTGVNSLTPSTMVLGEIVPFEYLIVAKAGAPADSSVELVATWDTVTTPSGDFGYDEAYQVYCAFVDTADPATIDPEGDASASFSSTMVGDLIQGTLVVEGLDPGDAIVVEAWVVLDRSAPPGVSGNVQARMDSSRTLSPDEDIINVGAETVNLQPDDNFLRAIMIQKVVSTGSDASQVFDFTGEINASLGHGQVSNPVIVVDGSYQVTETLPAGWINPSISCDDADSGGSGATVTFEVNLETILCTFTNTQASATTTTTAAPATTTTVPPTSTTAPTTQPTLPLTGGDVPSLGGLALSIVALGGLAILGARSRRPD